MFPAEHALKLGYANISLNGLKAFSNFLLRIRIFFLYRHFKQQFSLLDRRPGIFPAFDNFMNLPKLFLGLLGALSILPEIRGERLALKLCKLFFFAG